MNDGDPVGDLLPPEGEHTRRDALAVAELA
jgi:hypothetical protein